MWSNLLTGFALFLVFEGLLPFLSPEGFKRSMAQVLRLPSQTLRIVGLTSMLIGVMILYWAR